MKTLKILFVILVASFTTLAAQDLPDTFTHTLTSGNESYTINFSRFSSRGPLFEVVVQQPDGSFRTVDVGEPRSYIGTVDGQPGAVAACVRRRDGRIFTRMTLENGFEWIDYDGDLNIETRELTPSWPTFGLRSGGAGRDLLAADIYVDLTNRYYGTVGGTANDCLEMVDFSFTAINLIYLRDVNLLNRIGRVSIRGDLDQDPYKDDGGNMSNLLSTLNGVDNPWVSGPDSTTDHDLGTVIQSLAGGGVAGVGVIGSGGSANGGFNRGDFAGAGRHEWGHNWGLSHFDGRGEGEPLSPEGKTINSGNGLAKMSAPEMEKVLRERDDARSVLSNLGTTTPDMPPRAADDRFEIDSVLAGQTLSIQPLANDNDSNGESLSIVSVDASTSLGASVSLDSSTGTVAVNFSGSYPFGYDYLRYQISDQSGRTSSAVVHLQMSPAKADWEVTPAPVNGESLLMTASDKFEESGGTIEYFFEHVNGSRDSGWQTSRVFVASSLPADQAQIYRVYARVQNSIGVSLPSDDSSATPLSVSEGLLFADNFNRSSLNGSFGQSGEVSPVNYTLTTFGNVTAGLASNRLRINGPAGSDSLGALAFINDFNFGAPLLRDFDQVSIKVDIAGYSTVGSTRQMWLAVGQSLGDLQNQGGVNPGESAGDLVVAYRRTTNTLEIYKNGSLSNSDTVVGNLPNAPTEIELAYNSPSLFEGTPVSYEVYLDGRSSPHTSGTFTWSGDYQNYLSLGANLSDDALFDNLSIEVETTPGFTPPPLPSATPGSSTNTDPLTFTPDPEKTYYIENPSWGFRLAADGLDEDAYTVPLSEGGLNTEWKFVEHSAGRWHIDRAAGGPRPRIRTNNTPNPDMNVDTAVGVWTYYEITPNAAREGTFHLTLPDGPASYKRLRMLPDGNLQFDTVSNPGASEALRFVEVGAPSDYENWAAAQSVSDLGLASDDFDNDGLSNDEERIWGLDPADASSNNPYATSFDETGTFQYTRRNPALTGLDYSILSSTDLVNWTVDEAASQQPLATGNSEIETIDVTLDRHLGAGKVFIRVRATNQP